MREPTISFAGTSRGRRCMAALLRALTRAAGPGSRTRSFGHPDKTGHQVFLEPEGLDDPTVYPNGISTSLPAEVQEEYVHSSRGWKGRRLFSPAMPSNMIMSLIPRPVDAWPEGASGPVPCRADQRNDGAMKRRRRSEQWRG